MVVLVVDDNEANRKLLKRALLSWGHEVIEADSGAQAVDHCRLHLPDLILMDVMMPGMDGMETSRQIRALPGGAELSMIFVSALKEQEGLVSALDSGGDDYLSKPVDLAVLAAKIKAHQRIRDLQLELAERNAALERSNRALRREHELIGHYFDRAQRQNFLPDDMLRFHASSKAAFGGDFVFSRERPGGGLYLMLGDFTGHGLSAAMGSLPVAEIFARMTRSGASIGVIAREINQVLHTFLPDEIFCSASVLELDASGSLLQLWSGGLPNAYLFEPDGKLHVLQSWHMPLGILDDHEFDESVETLTVPAGSQLFLLTDGLTDVTDRRGGAPFGEARVKDVLAAARTVADPIEALVSAVRDYSGSAQVHDDASLVELTLKPLRPRAMVSGGQGGGTYPFALQLRLSAPELAGGGVVRRLVDMLATMPVIRARRAELHTIVSELVSNVIDHGFLGQGEGGRDYDAGRFHLDRAERLRELKDYWVQFEARLQCEDSHWILEIDVQHNGPERPVAGDATDDNAEYGRGLIILEALCDEVRIEDSGRRTRVRYRLEVFDE